MQIDDGLVSGRNLQTRQEPCQLPGRHGQDHGIRSLERDPGAPDIQPPDASAIDAEAGEARASVEGHAELAQGRERRLDQIGAEAALGHEQSRRAGQSQTAQDRPSFRDDASRTGVFNAARVSGSTIAVRKGPGRTMSATGLSAVESSSRPRSQHLPAKPRRPLVGIAPPPGRKRKSAHATARQVHDWQAIRLGLDPPCPRPDSLNEGERRPVGAQQDMRAVVVAVHGAATAAELCRSLVQDHAPSRSRRRKSCRQPRHATADDVQPSAHANFHTASPARRIRSNLPSRRRGPPWRQPLAFSLPSSGR